MKNFLIGITLAAILGGAYLLYIQQQSIATLSKKLEQVSTAPSNNLKLSPAIAEIDANIPAEVNPTNTQPTSQPPTQQPAQKPVVVFLAEGSIPITDKSQLQQRIVNPAIEYYQESSENSAVVSITIEPNTKESKSQYPYLGTIILANGGNNGFTISKQGGSISWWAPECMVCTFSDAYKAKYPDVVSQVQ